MNDQMPMFDDPIPETSPDAPKKPRKKPMRRKVKKARKVAVAAPIVPPAPKQRRKMRKVRVTNGHAGGRYSKEQYRVIGALMGMSVKERDAVFDIVKGLTK